MLCQRCQGEDRSDGGPRPLGAGCRPLTCERCGAAILTVAGGAVGVGDDTLAAPAPFRLANTGQPLFEPRPPPEGPSPMFGLLGFVGPRQPPPPLVDCFPRSHTP